MYPHVRALLFGLVLLALACLARPAAAAESTVAILGLDAVEVPEEAAQAVTAALRQRAQVTPAVRLLAGQKDLIEVKLVFGCMDERPACLAQAGQSLGVERLIYGSVRKAPGGPQVVLKLVDVRTARVEKFISESAPQRALRRDDPELAALAQRWVKALLVSGLKGGLVITSVPTGAEVQVDGIRVGKTPLSLPDVDGGGHLVALSLAGYEQEVRSVQVRGGVTHDVAMSLWPRGVPRPKPETVPGVTPPPPPPVAAPEASAAETGRRRGRALKVASYFMVGTAAILGGVAIYTWRTYGDDERRAADDLTVLQIGLGTQVPAEVAAFFNNRDAASACTPPQALVARAMENPVTATAYNNYMNSCSHGRSYASATTGLVATMGSLALLGVASYFLGDHLQRSAGKADKARGPGKALGLYRPRLEAVGPVLGATGGGVNMSFRF